MNKKSTKIPLHPSSPLTADTYLTAFKVLLSTPLSALKGYKVTHQKTLTSLNLKTIHDFLFLVPHKKALIVPIESTESLTQLNLHQESLTLPLAKVTLTHLTTNFDSASFFKIGKKPLIVTGKVKGTSFTAKCVFFRYQSWFIQYLNRLEEVVIIDTPQDITPPTLTFHHPQFIPSHKIPAFYQQSEWVVYSNSLDKNKILLHYQQLILPLLNPFKALLANLPIPDWLPATTPDFITSLQALHTSNSLIAHKRLGLDEQLNLKIHLHSFQQVSTPLTATTSIESFFSFFKQTPKPYQVQALNTLLNTLKSPHATQSILIGDVGTGKTQVFMYAALQATLLNLQVAVMAPTELLARQHYEKYAPLFKQYNLTPLLITKDLTPKNKRSALLLLQQGKAHIAFGTHSLIQDTVSFNNLSLVIIDEQHRFGVQQRLHLASKGTLAPHLLMVSATPIPRTLSMIKLKDLTPIQLNAPSNSNISTHLLAKEDRLDECMTSVIKAVQEGKKVFWVCSKVKKNDEPNPKIVSAEDRFESFVPFIPESQLYLIHGKLKPQEKEVRFQDFKFGAPVGKLLIASSVIEVGIDDPSTNIIIIENADQFGLVQLHQLRGRVGRGGQVGHCLLLYSTPLSAKAKARLTLLKNEYNGFKLAEQDLLLRGFGEILGDEQSGQHNFFFFNHLIDSNYLQDSSTDSSNLNSETVFNNLSIPQLIQTHEPIIGLLGALFDTHLKGV